MKPSNTPITLKLDHAFIACAPGAPEADELLRAGFIEGSGNRHPGQGTANRRFFFDNFMLEFIWISDITEATTGDARRTQLWERCSNREPRSNPFGILFRRRSEDDMPLPFRTWLYRPNYLPRGLAIEMAEGTTLQEPELCSLPFVRESGKRATEPTQHAVPFRRLRRVSAGVGSVAALSGASRVVEQLGLVSYFESVHAVLELEFEGSEEMRLDLQPTLPLVFCGAP